MAITINGIVCQELVANFDEGFDLLGGPTARKGFLCNWGDRYTVAQGLVGLSSSTSIGGTITLNTPAQYPERNTMYAHSIEISGAGPPTQGTKQVQWTNAIVWCNYACLPWSFSGIEAAFPYMQVDPNTPLIYCKQNITTSTAWMNIPTAKLKFSGSGNPIKDQFAAIPIFHAEIQLTFIRVPYFPAQQIFTSGKNPINSQTFLGLGAGYVFFNGIQNEQTRDTAGNMTLDITYSFSYQSVKWGYQWDAVGQAFDKVVTSTGGDIIGTSDLNSLIPAGYIL
jgi:hypothetical protein